MVTTLDVLSGGRAGLGIGAAWNGDEAQGLGLPFPATAERFERLEEILQACLQMWADGDEAYRGRYYTLERTLNVPAALSRPHPMLMVGGSGERKALRLVAQYADACNLLAGPDIGHKLKVLREHCERVGRSYGDIEKTTVTVIEPGDEADEVVSRLRGLYELGFTAVYATVRAGDPFPVLDMLGSRVIPEISGW